MTLEEQTEKIVDNIIHNACSGVFVVYRRERMEAITELVEFVREREKATYDRGFKEACVSIGKTSLETKEQPK